MEKKSNRYIFSPIFKYEPFSVDFRRKKRRTLPQSSPPSSRSRRRTEHEKIIKKRVISFDNQAMLSLSSNVLLGHLFKRILPLTRVTQLPNQRRLFSSLSINFVG